MDWRTCIDGQWEKSGKPKDNVMDIPAVTTFGLLRHGQTSWNREGRIQGHGDSPLTDQGKKQALAWGRRLLKTPWNRIIVSDLGRARQTADLVNQSLGTTIMVDQRLREQDWGHWVGRTLEQIKTEWPEELDRQVRAGWHFCPPEGENRIQLWERTRQALSDAAGRYPGQTILVVTHEGVIKALLYRLCNRRFLPGENPLIQPLHLHLLQHDGRELGIRKINAIRLKTGGSDAP